MLILTSCSVQAESTSGVSSTSESLSPTPILISTSPPPETRNATATIAATKTTAPSETPLPTKTPAPTRTRTPTAAPTATAKVVIITPDPNIPECVRPETLPETEVDVVGPSFCVVWLDEFDDERGFRVHLNYFQSGERFVYEVGPDMTQLIVPDSDAPRLNESLEQCLRRNNYEVTVVALRPDTDSLVSGIGVGIECVQDPSLPTATSTSIPTPVIILSPTTQSQNPPEDLIVFFYAIDGHLYRSDLAGSFVEQLTDAALNNPDDPDMVASIISYRPPKVSPDGRFIALNGGWGGATVLDPATDMEIGIGRGQAMFSPTWSPDSQHLAYISQEHRLCIYELNDEPDDCPFEQANELQEALWSPAGSTIAVAVVDPIPDGSPDCCTGQVWLVDALSGQAEVVGTYVTSFEPVPGEVMAWLLDGSGLLIKQTAEGSATLVTPAQSTTINFTEPVLTVSPNSSYFLHPSGAVSDKDGNALYVLFGNNCEGNLTFIHNWSPDSSFLAYTPLCRVNGELRDEAQQLYIVEAATGNLLWQQALSAELSLSAWSSDGHYLLLQGSSSGWPADASIWRLAADGSGTPEIVVEQGILLEVVPQWAE